MKENKLFTTIVVVIIGVLIGLGILAKQSRSPFFEAIYDQQIAILKGQEQIVRKIDAIGEFDVKDDYGLDSIIEKQKVLDARISMLESQMRALSAQGAKNKVEAPTQPTRPTEDLNKVHDIPVAHSPVIGKKDAPVTLVEFMDIQCPYCARFHTPLLEVQKAYPEKVNVIIKNFPLGFHGQAKNAAKAAFAAGEQGKYLEMINLLLENNRQLSEEKYEELAGQLGLDVAQFKKDYKGKEAQWESYIQADIRLGSQVGVRGTPTMFINGKQTRARTVEDYKKEIESILNK